MSVNRLISRGFFILTIMISLGCSKQHSNTVSSEMSADHAPPAASMSSAASSPEALTSSVATATSSYESPSADATPIASTATMAPEMFYRLDRVLYTFGSRDKVSDEKLRGPLCMHVDYYLWHGPGSSDYSFHPDQVAVLVKAGILTDTKDNLVLDRVTAAGRQYFLRAPNDYVFLCYGRYEITQTVASTETTRAPGQNIYVTAAPVVSHQYATAYHLLQMAPWTNSPEALAAFPDIASLYQYEDHTALLDAQLIGFTP